MKIVHIFDIFKEPHWNTFDIDFGEALDKSDQNHQSLIISTLKLSQNQYSQMYISFLHLCLWFIFLYYIYRTIFLSPSNIQFKTRDRTYPHLTPPHKISPPPPRKFRYFFAIQIMVTLWNKIFFSDEIPNRQNIGDIGDDMPNRQNIVYYSFLWKNLSKLKGLFAKDSGPLTDESRVSSLTQPNWLWLELISFRLWPITFIKTFRL